MAGVACVFLDICVSLEVGTQVTAVCKATVTLSTFKRFFPCVCSYVSLEQPRARECLSTQMALAGKSVGADVHLEGTQTRIYLEAVLTVKGLGPNGSAMKLLVLAQTRVCGVGFATVATGVSGFCLLVNYKIPFFTVLDIYFIILLTKCLTSYPRILRNCRSG